MVGDVFTFYHIVLIDKLHFKEFKMVSFTLEPLVTTCQL